MNTETRFTYEQVPCSAVEASLRRREDLRHIEKQISALQQEYDELMESPLPTTTTKQTALEPGDPGYDDAPLGLDVVQYQGVMEFDFRMLPHGMGDI